MAAQYLSQDGRVVQINIGGNDQKLVANKNISQEVRGNQSSASCACLLSLLAYSPQAHRREMRRPDGLDLGTHGSTVRTSRAST